MNIIWFIIGSLFGLGLKIGFDQYHDFILRQEAMTSKMEDVLALTKAMELAEKAGLKLPTDAQKS